MGKHCGGGVVEGGRWHGGRGSGGRGAFGGERDYIASAGETHKERQRGRAIQGLHFGARA